MTEPLFTATWNVDNAVNIAAGAVLTGVVVVRAFGAHVALGLVAVALTAPLWWRLLYRRVRAATVYPDRLVLRSRCASVTAPLEVPHLWQVPGGARRTMLDRAILRARGSSTGTT